MKIIFVLSCIIAISNAMPLADTTKEISASIFDSDGPQPVDEVIVIANDGEEHSKRVARHHGFGFGGPVFYSSFPVYGYGVPYYGGFGGGYGYGRGWGRRWGHHHHHHRYWG